MSDISDIRGIRATFDHIPPVISDFDALDAAGGDTYTAISETARLMMAVHQMIPQRYQTATATDPTVLAWTENLTAAAAPARLSRVPYLATGPSLLLLGPTGTGKTHQGYGALRHLSIIGVNTGAVATTAADIYAKLRPRAGIDSETEFDRYARARMLFLDDLGAAKGSEWTEEINYRLINHRYEHGLATLITSNVPPKQLGERLGERVASRLTEMAQFASLKGNDRRLGQGAAA